MAKLSPSDIKLLLPELHSICDKWYNIGLELDLSVDYLEELDGKLFTHKVHVSTCLKRVLTRWLKSNQATCQELIKVLNSDLVKGRQIAEALRQKFISTSLTNKSCTSTTASAEGGNKRAASPQKVRKTRKRSRQSSVQLGSRQKLRYDVDQPESFAPEDFAHMPTAGRVCIKCGRVPRSPWRSTCCDQVYCKPCSLKTIKCANHKKVIEYVCDAELRNILSKLSRKCPNHSRGCDWKGCGWQLGRHLSQQCTETKSTRHNARPEVSSTENGEKLVVKRSRNIDSVAVTTRSAITSQATRKQPMTTQSTRKKSIPSQSTHKQTESKQGQQLSKQFPNEPLERRSCYMLKTPPFNLAMEHVSEYIDSDEAWLSDGFFSHQIGYKMCLAVRIESSSEGDGMLNVILGIASAEGPHSGFLEYPCSGFVTVMILNPMEDQDHQVLELMFALEKPNIYVYNEIGGEVVKVPQNYITPMDCLFFHVDKVDIDRERYRLWLLDASLKRVDGESLDSDDSELLY